MKKIILMLKTQFKKNIAHVFIALGCAAIMLMIHNMFTDFAGNESYYHMKIGVIDNDNSALSQDLKRYLTEEHDMVLTENLSYDELSTVLIEKRLSAIIEIESGFEASAQAGAVKPLVITTHGDYENTAFLKVYLESYMRSVQILSSASAGDTVLFNTMFSDFHTEGIEISTIDAESINREDENRKMIMIASIGFFSMLIFGIGLALAYSIIDDRLLGVYNRIQSSPIKPYQYLTGNIIFGILLCFLTIFTYSGMLMITGFKIGISFTVFNLLLVLYSILSIGFSIMAGMLLKSKNSIMALIIGTTTLGCILGGSWFPLDFSPKPLQTLAKITPQYWFMDALRKLSDNPDAKITLHILALVLFAMLFFLIALYSFTSRNKSK